MKKVFSMITLLLLLWGVLMFVDYNRAYLDDNKLLFTVNLTVNEEYTKKNGLGYSVIDYNYDRSNVKEGQVIKEFTIFNFVIAKEVVVLKK